MIGTCAELKKRHAGCIEIVSHLAQQILVDDEVADMLGLIGCQAGRGRQSRTLEPGTDLQGPLPRCLDRRGIPSNAEARL